MKYFEAPKGAVKFKIGDIEHLPINAEEIKLFMISGDPSIYIVPVSEMSNTHSKIQMEESEGFLLEK